MHDRSHRVEIFRQTRLSAKSVIPLGWNEAPRSPGRLIGLIDATSTLKVDGRHLPTTGDHDVARLAITPHPSGLVNLRYQRCDPDRVSQYLSNGETAPAPAKQVV